MRKLRGKLCNVTVILTTLQTLVMLALSIVSKESCYEVMSYDNMPYQVVMS